MADEQDARPAEAPVIGKPFEPGRSGNPGGRPKVVAEIKALMQDNAARAVQVLLDGLEGPDPKNAKACAELLLAYVLGKPKQTVELGGENGGPIGVEVIRRVIIDPRAGNSDT